jgi:glycosyltransferase involved in cell wall biosynthesis
MKIIVLQPTVPSYRRSFFRRLRAHFGQSFTVYASEQDLGILTHDGVAEVWEHRLGTTVALLPDLHWQRGVLSIPFSQGDVIVVSGNPRYLSTLALLLKARWKGAKTIWWGHYWSSTSSPSRVRLRLLLMRMADAVLLYTDSEIDEYLASNRDRDRPVAALNNGLEIEPIERMRLSYSAAERPKRALFVGRLTGKTGFPLLLESMARAECADLHLDVIGQTDGTPDFRQLATSLGISERVNWHGGTVDETKIAEIANRCRIFVYPGSVGLSLIHGLAYGLPVVVHDDRWSHMPEIAAFQDETNGLAFRKNDVESAAGVVGRLINDVALLNEFSRAAIASITKSFNARDMASRFISLVERVKDCRP